MTEHATLTDLVLLHACGDSLFNAKMKNASTTIQVLSARCIVYYSKGALFRFENIAKVIYVGRKGTDILTFIPRTARYVSTNCGVQCMIHASVDEIVADYIGEYSKFGREPGQLDVSVGNIYMGRGETLPHLAYITHLRDHRDYSKKMTNVKRISMTSGADFKPISGVVIDPYVEKCSHFVYRISSTEQRNMWNSKVCTKCGIVTGIITKKGKVCRDIPPCESITISDLGVSKIFIILGKIPKTVERILIRTTTREMNAICNGAALDLIPSSVKMVTLEIITDLKLPLDLTFSGVPKRYPFIIKLSKVTHQWIRIDDFTNVDDCCYSVVSSSVDRFELMSKYPRLSFVYA